MIYDWAIRFSHYLRYKTIDLYSFLLQLKVKDNRKVQKDCIKVYEQSAVVEVQM